ncbi:deoxyribodipyrimidine photo-lyase [Bacillus ectoiniformans]|uniref:FAD-binding domain-containing protein n=1 Tax=Bacillus ectoiniformans TaxID=1494429 RepID=UPI00195D64B4|nr:FAD-binding domain-containing protein [Bacillus ectoiniformans]MBM7648238.1 deoxyribodipyrimidine photo-lyase [Bacillus ectoiniformans]
MIHVIWYKRDLRVLDHEPLVQAAKHGEPVLPIYIVEPSIWEQNDLSVRHFQFIKESLSDLSKSLFDRGVPLYTGIAKMEDLLQSIYDTAGPFTLYSEEESATPSIRERDRRVKSWMDNHQLEWKEYSMFGSEKLAHIDDVQTSWHRFMSQPLIQPPDKLTKISKAQVPNQLAPSLAPLDHYYVEGLLLKRGQTGGERNAEETLNTFLTSRFQHYQQNRKKPAEAGISSSRLSPYLAWGNISLRQVVQRAEKALLSSDNISHKKQLSSYISRLQSSVGSMIYYHKKHNRQSEDSHTGLNDARKWKEEMYQYWLQGRTGIPMIDAAMKALRDTGWLNFRSRAMLISFACNTLLLDWQKPASALAQLSLDYQPGILNHQVEFYAGVLEESDFPIFDPVNQGKQHDPDGKFVKQHLPELLSVPSEYIHEPWLYPRFHTVEYSSPIVDIKSANEKAKSLRSQYNQQTETRASTKMWQMQSNRHQTDDSANSKQDTPKELSLDFFSETD